MIEEVDGVPEEEEEAEVVAVMALEVANAFFSAHKTLILFA